ncbi:hypothetical protein H0H92_012098 [Tricholoma furcatifolium]|nr:hypothetical protein H0H92_012098 [Tricholoma furcatifolium]
MLHSRLRLSLLLSLAATCLADNYTWPSPQYDALEQMLYEGRRPDGSSIANIVHPCKFRTNTNASIAAEWLRFAFHDAITADVSAGTGGVDGSIAYELNRTENFGAGFTDTLSDFQVYPNKYVSRSDIIALGAVFAVSTCGGPIIPFRGGRIDVWEAGPAGVPQPQEDLQTNIGEFSRAGFSTSEMIQLTACGHTMGGVRSTDFPQLVAPNANSDMPVFDDFDTTVEFDNVIVTQYLDGSTQDILVVGSNTTMDSDLRVFSADGNVTMNSMSTPDAFASTCQSILERMIETVAHGITLTNEIAVIPAKVHDVQLTFDEKNAFVFQASFRLQQSISGTVNKNRTVTMLWCDRYGSNANCNGNTKSSLPAGTVYEEPNLSPVSQSQGFTFINYNFVVPVDADVSISKFWFTVNENDGSSATTYNNGGSGYVYAQDQLLFVPILSTNTLVQNSSLVARGGGSPIAGLVNQYFIVAAVRDGSDPSQVYMNAYDSAIANFPAPLNTTVNLQMNSSISPLQGYSFYTGTVQDSGNQLTLDIYSVLSNGTTYLEDFKQTTLLSNTPYVAPTNVTSLKSSSSPNSSTRLADVFASRLVAGFAFVVGVVLAAS